jgi:hypothetical protein
MTIRPMASAGNPKASGVRRNESNHHTTCGSRSSTRSTQMGPMLLDVVAEAPVSSL